MSGLRTLVIAVLAALAAAGSAVPAAEAAAKVRQMGVFRHSPAVTKRVSAAETTVRVGARRCAVGDGTPLAALARGLPGRLRLRDFGACSSRPGDAAGLLVTGIGDERNRGYAAGSTRWVAARRRPARAT